jgi:hypothetical protein
VLTDGTVTDCPDWQEQVVGPGGTPIGGGGITVLGQLKLTTGGTFTGGPAIAGVGSVTCSNTAAGYAMLAFALNVALKSPSSNGSAVVSVTGDLTESGTPQGMAPQAELFAQTNAVLIGGVCSFCGLVYLSQAAAVLELQLFYVAVTNGTYNSIYSGPGTAMMIWTP